jgi:hypothetical protein
MLSTINVKVKDAIPTKYDTLPVMMIDTKAESLNPRRQQVFSL